MTLFVTIFAMALGFFLMDATAAGRTDNLWWLPPVITTRGQEVDKVFYFIFWLTGAVFVATQFLLIYYCVKYRFNRKRQAVYSHGNNKFEIVWTTIPTLIFFGLFFWSNHLWKEFHQTPPEDAITIEVTAEQYGFNVRYPGPDGKLGAASDVAMSKDNKLGLDANDPAGADDFVTYNDMTIPVGRPIHVLMRSRDVIHAFYVPSFRLYQDMVPGRTIDWVWFVTTETGAYDLACNQLCGAGHYNMKAKISIVSDEEYQEWLKDFLPKPEQPVAMAQPQ
ncbi:cytochrome c oxidase subunit II [Kamptonema cortianum]|uniref:Cytochrome c oxidase subunit 2 n=1 Tax=Geitlerinema calcuttense NRMC-F 0142 TaxID=2922238 RepID=A0ABT7M3I3_9CYAN|nr:MULTISPECIES: cytochrome c oxidase subunit II [Cyanophyceae]MDK3161785.1 cytochrome c oxidase subunit II [Kamptonema cortianum]MDL5054357.1 cytochrome c oxidase subunit II [Oscillatoria laete-virens NRMC-F 0139]MDL5057920.1 cytochrome c oxidase subunit II [Geitlerinema calcuttense NRMC-F 0142]